MIVRLTAAYLAIFALVLLGVSVAVYLLMQGQYHSLLQPALATPEGAQVYAAAMRRVALAIAGADVPLLAIVGAASWLFAQLSVRPLLEARAREREFIADAAHELRSPLASIATLAQATKHVRDEEVVRESLETIARSALDANVLIGDLLTLARAPAPAMLVCEPVDLAAVAHACAREFAPRIEAAGLTLEIRVEPVIINGDARRLRELLRNLMENAMRHARSHIVLETKKEKGRASLRVVDDGPGVDPRLRSTIFDRFVSGAQSTGLGLAIAQWVARAHEGSLILEERSPGASFVALFDVL